MSRRWRRNRRLKCWCGGYWFPHRRGGGACEYSPRRDYYHALRAGLSQAEAMSLLAIHIMEAMFPIGELNGELVWDRTV